MSQSQQPSAKSAGQGDLQSALFAQLVIQQANLAMMLLGKVPNPETGQPQRDLEAARLFIDQLEMLEAKTKGNLSPEESNLLKQSLMSLRLAFVEAVESPEPQSKPPSGGPPQSGQSVQTGPSAGAPAEESHKKFSKKY
jgi:hypothetical protein